MGVGEGGWAWQEREGGVFEGGEGVDTPMYIMLCLDCHWSKKRIYFGKLTNMTNV